MEKGPPINSAARIKPDKGNNLGFYSVFVPLYLVVLAFFILLNSIATIEKKKKNEALGSLYQTFSTGPNIELPIEGFLDSVGNQLALRNYFAPIADIAKDSFELVDADIIETGNKIRLVIPTNKFFSENSSQILRSQKLFLTNLSEKLVDLSKETDISIELLMGINRNENEDASAEVIRLSTHRVAEIARTMSNMGVPNDNIIVGIRPESSNGLYMTFHNNDEGGKTYIENK